jgi:hypothetical protein
MATALAAACGPGQRGFSEEARQAEQVRHRHSVGCLRVKQPNRLIRERPHRQSLTARECTAATSARSFGWSWLTLSQPGREVERVMGIEPTLVVWDTRKEWPLPGRSRVREGPLVSVLTQSRMSVHLSRATAPRRADPARRHPRPAPDGIGSVTRIRFSLERLR